MNDSALDDLVGTKDREILSSQPDTSAGYADEPRY
jgi:hypothetical protein